MKFMIIFISLEDQKERSVRVNFSCTAKRTGTLSINVWRKDHRFPEITSWIRANKKDFELVKEIGMKETGILVQLFGLSYFLQDENDQAGMHRSLFICSKRMSGDRNKSKMSFGRYYPFGHLLDLSFHSVWNL